MTIADMTTLSYALGVALLAVAVIGIVGTLAPGAPARRTYGATIYDDREDRS
jgi:hypothetical protein